MTIFRYILVWTTSLTLYKYLFKEKALEFLMAVFAKTYLRAINNDLYRCYQILLKRIDEQ